MSTEIRDRMNATAERLGLGVNAFSGETFDHTFKMQALVVLALEDLACAYRELEAGDRPVDRAYGERLMSAPIEPASVAGPKTGGAPVPPGAKAAMGTGHASKLKT